MFENYVYQLLYINVCSIYPIHSHDYNSIVDRTVIISAATLMPILGVTWIIGLLAVNNHTEVFSWIFTILNSLQVHMHVVLIGSIRCFYMIIGPLNIFLLCTEARTG